MNSSLQVEVVSSCVSTSCRITFIFPNYAEYDLEIILSPVTTVDDIARDVFTKVSTSLRHEDVEFLLRSNILMERSKPVSRYGLKSGDRIALMTKTVPSSSTTTTMADVGYAQFIRSSYPIQNNLGSTHDFPINGTITIGFGSSRERGGKVSLFTPALVDCTALRTTCEGNMLKYFGGDMREAIRHGFVSWQQPDKPYPQRIYLLELPPDAAGFGAADFSRLERVRYSASGVVNRGYDGGDDRSWQRYSRSLPVSCLLSEETAYDLERDEEVGVVCMKPLEALRRGAYYAILLCNNVPVIPYDGCDHLGETDFTCFSVGHTTEDYLIVFRTDVK